jgi:hypothetical protein
MKIPWDRRRFIGAVGIAFPVPSARIPRSIAMTVGLIHRALTVESRSCFADSCENAPRSGILRVDFVGIRRKSFRWSWLVLRVLRFREEFL